jgi:hypothetical protein
MFKDYEYLLAKYVSFILKVQILIYNIQNYGLCGKFSTQRFEHKNKISKQNYHLSSAKEGGRIKYACKITLHLINYNIVRMATFSQRYSGVNYSHFRYIIAI